MAKIRIENLKARTTIGAHPWEREKKQDVIINVTLDYDATQSIKSDTLEDTVDYETLAKTILEKTAGSKYFLLEKLAQMILETVFEIPHVREVTVRVEKPRILPFADCVSVELSQKKK